MQNFLAPMNEYANLISALSTFTIALLTILLWRENRFLRKADGAPQVVAYLSPHPDGNGGVHFVLANVGRGPALDVSFKLLHDAEDFAAHRALIENNSSRTALTVLPQHEKLKALLGIGYKLFGQVNEGNIGPLKPFKVRIQYFDLARQKRITEQTIDITQFYGLKGLLDKANDRKIAETLEKMEGHLSFISQRSAKFSVLEGDA